MPDELAIALAAVAAAVIAVPTRRVVATPTEQNFLGTSPRLKRFTVRRRRTTVHRLPLADQPTNSPAPSSTILVPRDLELESYSEV